MGSLGVELVALAALAACCARKAGDSATLRRMKTPIPMSTALKRKGTRQPHEMNCSSGSR